MRYVNNPKYVKGKNKILFFDLTLQFLFSDLEKIVGGAAHQQYSWIYGLSRCDWVSGVLVFSDNKITKRKNKHVEFLNIYNSNKGIKKIRILYYRIPKIICAIKKFQPTYIYQACAGFETGLAAILALFFNIPFIYRVANDTDVDGRCKIKLSLYQRKMYEFGLRKASYVLCQNKYQFEKLTNIVERDKLLIVHNPFNFNKVIKHYNVPFSQRTYIGWMGIFQKQKNLMGLYNIVLDLPHIFFKIAGDNTMSVIDATTKGIIEKLKQCSNVEFLGYLTGKEKNDFLAHSMALINTSYHEGFSNTFLESFAVGTPVITTRAVDPDNIIELNALGFISERIEGISKNISKLFDIDYSVMSNKCKKYVIENHDPIQLSKRMLEFISY